MDSTRHLRFHEAHAHLASTFGGDRFGRIAELFARAFGTPYFLVGQSAIVVAWVAYNRIDGASFDPFPFILLNLVFSLQAAYAAPLILLAETRQADRARVWSDADARQREDLAASTLALLEENTELTRRVADLTERITLLAEGIHNRVASSEA